jgi:hypothetical protein
MNWRNIKRIRNACLTLNKVFYALLNRHKTTAIIEKDWDNLIILDACRFDMFKTVNSLPGKLEYIYSKGSSTGHFLAGNFKKKHFYDTVYVTANPMVDYYVKDSFLSVISVWKEGWYEPYQTVLPETVLYYALKANEKFPDKRLIIHFMQPHSPFIGEKSRKVIGKHEGILMRNVLYGEKTTHTKTVWHLLKGGKLDRKTVWEAYEENLVLVLEEVKKLIRNLTGKTVITSDHANLFGEWLFPFPLKEFGHPGGIYKKSALQVPWHVIEGGERKKIQKEVDHEREPKKNLETDEIKKKLEDLGYL